MAGREVRCHRLLKTKISCAPLKTGAGLAAALAIQLTLGRFLERQEMGKKALLGTFASVLAGVFFAVSRQGLGFYFAIAAVEGALTLGISYLVQKGVVLLLEHGKAVIPSGEEMLSLLLLAGGVLAGLASLQNRPIGAFLLPMASAFFLLLAARQEGIGGGAAAVQRNGAGIISNRRRFGVITAQPMVR